MFWLVEVVRVAKILVWGKTDSSKKINLLSLEQCIVRSNSTSNNPTGCLNNLILIPYSGDSIVCNKKKAGII